MPPALSSSQLPLWLGQRLFPESPLYNMALALVIEGPVQPARFAAAWQAIRSREPVLRTSIREQNGRPHLAVRSPGDAGKTAYLDFSSAADADERFRVWAKDRCAQPMALDGDLVESILVRLAPERFGWFLNQHHLVTDAGSTMLLCGAVAAAYAQLERNESTTIAVGGLGLADPANAAMVSTAAPRDSAVATYWRDKASSCPATEFYGRRVIPTRTEAVRTSIGFGPERARQFQDACREDGFRNLFNDMALFTGWATVLLAWMHRVSGQTSLGFVAPAQNRPTPAARRSLGLFIEMFPFAVELADGESFRSLGRKCAAELRDWLRHAGPGAAAGEKISANVVLNFRTGDIGDFAGLPWHAEWIHSGHADAAQPVRLQVYDYEGRGAFRVALDLNETAFSAPWRERALAHFETVLAEFLRDRDQPIDAFDLLTPEERDAQIERFNAPAAAPLPELTVIDLFREQVGRSPDATVLQEGSRTLTFAVLARQVDAVASALLAAGIDRGGIVAIYAARSVDTVAAILGILVARAAYVPIDASYPPARVQQILARSGAKLVLTSATLADRLPKGPWGVRRIDDLVSGEPITASLSGPSLDDRAYVIFTSGSTGTPKGVPITHAGLADYLTWAEREYVRGDRLSFALCTSLAFDLTVTSLFLPLITGGTLVIHPDSDGPVDDAFLAMMRANGADIVKLTPSHLQLMRQFDLTRSRIRRMIVGGEDLKVELAAAIVRQFGRDVEIYNEYGPTEAVVGCMIHRFDPVADAGCASVPIGRPADHVQLYVVNAALQPVPEGTPGELCIARHGLAAGYHGEPALTAERFVPNPWRLGERLYRTGDLVRFLRPGCLDFLGRIDRQVKLSGHRVELREIEQAVASHPAIAQAVVWVAPAPAVTAGELTSGQRCVRCGLPSNYPGATFDAAGVCRLCHSYDEIRERARNWFHPLEELRARILAKRNTTKSDFDCLHLFSGGKDSTYALCRLVEMGLRVYAFTLDNGYISDDAKANIRRVVATLGVAHEFGSTPAMNAIFKDSLMRFSNVCNGCYKTIYTLGINRARELRIPVLVTGLSRGQFFETRLTPELFRDSRFTPEEVDRATLAARKTYHRTDDAVHRLLDVRAFADDRVFEEVEILDFYRYCDVSLDEMLAHLRRAVPWVRPADTGRSTNCLINDVGIYIHQRERGFHNYALPYSWDVRLGHKTRDEAVNELEDVIDVDRVRQILRTIDYDENRLTATRSQRQVVAFYVACAPVDATEVRRHVEERLPRAMVPGQWVALERMPLTSNGKVDTRALARQWTQAAGEREAASGPAPSGPVQERIAVVWQEILGRRQIAADDNFFGLGGNSLAALEVVLRLCTEFELALALPVIFQHPTIAALATVIEQQLLQEVTAISEDDARRLIAEDTA